MPKKATNRTRDIISEFSYKVTKYQTELFTKAIPIWYKKNKRDLPWRESANPYTVWLSEIILQQTRVEQGLPYYFRFVNAFPDVHQLANAPITKVLKLWEGLGYYSRAHNLHDAAKMLVQNFDGVFPKTMNELKALKGVGDYTAAAISSICFGEKVPVVDGNVLRVVCRYFDIDDPIERMVTKRKVFSMLKMIMQKVFPADFNQGMMELGSLICKPVNPSCDNCPLAQGCIAFKENLIELRPKKLPSKKAKIVYYNYLVIQKGNLLAVRKRPDSGIWKSMYELPFIESFREIDTAKALSIELNEQGITGVVPYAILSDKVHLLTHRRIEARFWSLQKIPNAVTIKQLKCVLVDCETWSQFPFPVLISNFLRERKLIPDSKLL